MGSITRRGSKLYLRYIDSDGTERMRLARGASTLAEAKPLLAAIELRLQRKELGIAEKVEETAEEKARRTITVAELGAKFTTGYSSAKVKSIETYRTEARRVLEARVYPHIGRTRAADLTTGHVEAMVSALSDKGYAGASVRLALAALSRAFVWGRKTGLIDCDSPVKGAERPAAKTGLEYLGKDEVIKLLAHLERMSASLVVTPTARSLHAIVAFCIYTGCRKGEAMGLRWQDLQLDAGRVDIMRSYATTPKSGKSRHVPLHGELARILRLWRDRPDRGDDRGLVFPVEGRSGRRMGDRGEMLGLNEAYLAAGVNQPAKAWHALRHTFASHFMMAGGNILTLQKLLGHSDLKMTMIYAHLSPNHLAAEVARMSFASERADVVRIDQGRRYNGETDSHTLVG